MLKSLKAVKKDIKSLEHVKYLRLSPKEYAEICEVKILNVS